MYQYIDFRSYKSGCVCVNLLQSKGEWEAGEAQGCVCVCVCLGLFVCGH